MKFLASVLASSAGSNPGMGSTLQALTLSGSAYPQGASAGTVIGAVQNKTTGSTLSLSDAHSGAVAISGSNLVVGATPPGSAGTFSITIVETYAGATGSPKSTTLSITAVAETVTTTINVANRGTVLLASAAVSSTKRACHGQVLYRTGRKYTKSIAPVWANWYIQNSTTTPEPTPGNTVTIEASAVEWNGVNVPLTYSSSTTATLTDGQVSLQADLVAATAFGVSYIPPYTWITVKYDVDIPSTSSHFATGIKTNRSGEQMCFYDPANRNNADITQYGVFNVPTGATTGITGYHPIMLAGVLATPDVSHVTVGDSIVYGSFDATGDGQTGEGWRARACFSAGLPYFSMAIGGHELVYYSSGHTKRAGIMSYFNDGFLELGTNDFASTATAAATMIVSARSVFTDFKNNLVGAKYATAMAAYFPRGAAVSGYVDGTLSNQRPLGPFLPGERKDQLVRLLRQDVGSATYNLSALYDPRTSASSYKQRWYLSTASSVGATQFSLVGTATPRIGDVFSLEMDLDPADVPMTTTTLSAAVSAGATTFTMPGTSSARPPLGTTVMVESESRTISGATGSGPLTITVSKAFTSAHSSGAAVSYFAGEVPPEAGTLTNAVAIGATSFTVNTVNTPQVGSTFVFEPGLANTESVLVNTVSGSTGAWVVSGVTTPTKAHSAGATVSIPCCITTVTGSGTTGSPWVVTISGAAAKAHPANSYADCADLWPVRSFSATTAAATTLNNTSLSLNASTSVPECVMLEPGTSNLEYQNAVSVTGSGPYVYTIDGVGWQKSHASGVAVVAVSSGDLTHPTEPVHVNLAVQAAAELLTHPVSA